MLIQDTFEIETVEKVIGKIEEPLLIAKQQGCYLNNAVADNTFTCVGC